MLTEHGHMPQAGNLQTHGDTSQIQMMRIQQHGTTSTETATCLQDGRSFTGTEHTDGTTSARQRMPMKANASSAA